MTKREIELVLVSTLYGCILKALQRCRLSTVVIGKQSRGDIVVCPVPR